MNYLYKFKQKNISKNEIIFILCKIFYFVYKLNNSIK